ncbi:ImmA/IrrE family metallo-endopeptidase [Carbonactinospora thermoautotrophica]|uniref:ImmA/IrrE family metallo-endopeptidase n=1 Tax=Carbonactinospora thermoautotrophica TaxID=1469144 RepID=UPI003558D2B0
MRAREAVPAGDRASRRRRVADRRRPRRRGGEFPWRAGPATPTAAHELGHFVLGDEYSNDVGIHASRQDREQVVEAFAAELLLPVDVFRSREWAVPGAGSRPGARTEDWTYPVAAELSAAQGPRRREGRAGACLGGDTPGVEPARASRSARLQRLTEIS